MLAPPAPYDAEWPPITCVLTQTGNPTQLIDGFLERFFNDSSNPACPSEGGVPAPEFVRGRNYWHDSNNSNDDDKYTFAEQIPTDVHGNGLGTGGPDPRLVQLFMTGFNSFGGSGNALFPIINFGSFYITGVGVGRPGGGLTDPRPVQPGELLPGCRQQASARHQDGTRRRVCLGSLHQQRGPQPGRDAEQQTL